MKSEIKKKGSAGDIDTFIGQKLLGIRKLRAMSQEVLSQKMGIFSKYKNMKMARTVYLRLGSMTHQKYWMLR